MVSLLSYVAFARLHSSLVLFGLYLKPYICFSYYAENAFNLLILSYYEVF